MEKQCNGLTEFTGVLRDSRHAMTGRRQAILEHERIADIADYGPWDMRDRVPEALQRILRRRGTLFLNDESGTAREEKCQDTVVRVFSRSLLPFLQAPCYWRICV